MRFGHLSLGTRHPLQTRTEGNVSPESTSPENLHDPRLLRQDLEDLRRQQEVAGVTQAGTQATEAATEAGAQATQAATQAGQAAAQAATQAGQAATTAAAQAGLATTVGAGAVAFVIGIFLGITIARS
jgi:hypothetical protein